MEMEEPELIKIEASEETEKIAQSYDCSIIVAIFVSALFIGISLKFFTANRFYDTDYAIDEGVFGTYGDFLGGVLGTAFAFYGMVLMIRTFQDQIKSNDKFHKTNEKLLAETRKANSVASEQIKVQCEQNFNNHFNTYLKLYNEAIEEYHSPQGNKHGMASLVKLADDFSERTVSSKAAYGKRFDKAVAYYEELYALNCIPVSMHFRTLYQLVCLISNAQYVDENVKRSYAKAVRGRLNEAELLFLRYNCYTPAGKKMQAYVNEFNLLKHIPVMKLLEFKKWRDMIGDEEQCTALNLMFLQFRKCVCSVLDGASEIRKEQLVYGKHWSIVVMCRISDNMITVKIQEDKSKSRRGSKLPNIEKAFDKLQMKNVEGLFFDYFRELLFTSNFKNYNAKDTFTIQHRSRGLVNGVKEVYFVLKSDYPIILSQRQISIPSASPSQSL